MGMDNDSQSKIYIERECEIEGAPHSTDIKKNLLSIFNIINIIKGCFNKDHKKNFILSYISLLKI